MEETNIKEEEIKKPKVDVESSTSSKDLLKPLFEFIENNEESEALNFIQQNYENVINKTYKGFTSKKNII